MTQRRSAQSRATRSGRAARAGDSPISQRQPSGKPAGGPAGQPTGGPAGGQGKALALLCSVQLLLLLDFSVVNVALPTIRQSLGVSPTMLPWVISAYALTFGGLLLLGGRLSDILGRRRMFVVGLVVFGAGSLIGGVATAPLVLVVMRGVQGVGAAFIAPAVLSLITTTFPEGPARNRAVGWFSAAAAGGFALGVIVGGLLTEVFGWRSVLFINVPLVAAAVPLAYRWLAESRTAQRGAGGYDVLGAVTATAGLACVILGFTEVPAAGPGSARVLIPLIAGIVLLIAFGVVETRTDRPLISLDLLRSRTIRVANLVSLLLPGIMGSIVLLLSLFLGQALQKSPLVVGLSFLPLGLTVGLAAPASAILASRVGAKWVLVGGSVIAAAGVGLLSRAGSHYSYAGVILPGMIIAGIGFAAFFTTSTVVGTSGVADADQGLASGLLNTAQQVGTALGVAVLVTIANDRALHSSAALLSTRLGDGLRVSLVVAAGIALLTAVVAAIALPWIPAIPMIRSIDTNQTARSGSTR